MIVDEIEPLPFLRVRGRSFMALVLQPVAPVEAWLAALDAQRARSAAFFDQRPVIVDLSALPSEGKPLSDLVDELERRDIRIIGVEGADSAWTHAEAWGRTPLNTAGRPDRLVEIPDDPVSPEPPAPPEPGFLVHEGPVRSGQSVVFERGDLVVLGSVASGAEVIAGGSVHVYGALRGRAIAGFLGLPSARVFCRSLEAELVAIDGVYLLADDMEPKLRGRAVQARRDGDTVELAPLD